LLTDHRFTFQCQLYFCAEPVNETVWMMMMSVAIVVGVLVVCVIVVIVIVVVLHKQRSTTGRLIFVWAY